MLNSDEVLARALEIVEMCDKSAIIARLAGGVAIRAHCSRSWHLAPAERLLHDIDLVVAVEHASAVEELLLNGMSLKAARSNAVPGSWRLRFKSDGNAHIPPMCDVDVYISNVSYSHRIPIAHRLKVDYPSIPLAELLLTKLQSAKFDSRDQIDSALLLLDHSLGIGDDETINTAVVRRLCGRDWGLERRVALNLCEVSRFVVSWEAMPDFDRLRVLDKIASLTKELIDGGKTVKWRFRQLLGPTVPWEIPVDDDQWLS